MLARTSFLASLAFALLAACGGNVVVDQPLNGGAGGTSTTSSSSSSGSSGTTTATTTITGTTTTSVTTTTITTSTTTTTWVGPCGGLVLTPDPSCQSCVQGSCCAQLSACAPGSPCAQLLTCSQQCPSQDFTCQDKCKAVYGAGAQPLSNLTACANNDCGIDACYSEVCGVAGAPGPICDVCVNQHLCGELDACVNDAWCVECLAGNQANCEENPLYNKLFSLLEQWCGQACSF